MNAKTLTAIAILTLFSSCEQASDPSADKKQREATAEMLAEADRQIGMPNITNFTERKLAKTILELRDTEGLRTWTYIVDMHGKLHFLTESIGYGLPYSVQFTNPERLQSGGNASSGYYGVTMPQADPNGLFMPEGLSATWIIAATENGPKPLYVEPSIIVSPVPLHDVDE